MSTPLETLSVDSASIKRLHRKLQRLRADTARAALDALREGEENTIGEIRIRMAAAKSGRAYRRGRKVHIASAPGEAPAIDTGELAGSVREFDGAATSTAAWVTFGTDVPHGVYTEFGTSRMAPRPWLRVTTREMFPRVVRDVARALKRFYEEVSRWA